MSDTTTEKPATHTPGPWKADGFGRFAVVRGADATIVAVRHRLPGPTHEANTRLIAAAPDLLQACKELVWALRESSSDRGLIAQHGDALDKGLSVIAKIEGGAS